MQTPRPRIAPSRRRRFDFALLAAARLVIIVALCALPWAGCKSDTSATLTPAVSAVTLSLRQTPITVDVVADEHSRLQHVRLRTNLPANTGMLLVFQSDDFFKVPTDKLYLTLDALLLDPAGKVLVIQTMKEGSGEFESPVAARYALLAPGGLAATSGIAVGETIAIPPAVAALSEPLRTPVRLGASTIGLEIAATDLLRQRGLMYRQSLPADAGMIFVFEKEQRLAFWMKDTRIPLDIVYLDRDGRVDSIKHMAPFDTNGTPSDGHARYAIELNLGVARNLGLKKGDMIDLPPAMRNPKNLE